MKNEQLAALISSLLSITLMLGVMGVGVAAIFAIPPVHAFLTGLVCVLAAFMGGFGTAKSYKLLYKGEWAPEKVKKLHNLQAILSLLALWLLLSAIVVV